MKNMRSYLAEDLPGGLGVLDVRDQAKEEEYF